MSTRLDEEQDSLAVTVSIVLTVIFTSMVWYFGGNYEPNVVNTLLDTSVSIILTGIVAAIYYRQWRTEKEQAEIGREQKEIEDAMKDLQSQPALDVVKKEPTKTGWKLYIGNFGFGPAHNLELEIDLDTGGDEPNVQTTNVQLEKQIDDPKKDSISANAILPKSEVETFVADDIDMHTDDSDSISLPTLFEELDIFASEECQVDINLTIRGKDAFGREYTANAGDYTIIVDDLSGVSEYNVNAVLSYERN